MKFKTISVLAVIGLTGGVYIYSQDKPKETSFEEVAKLKGQPKYVFAKLSSKMLGYDPDILKQSKVNVENETKIANLLEPSMEEMAQNGSSATGFSATMLRVYFMQRADTRSAAQVSQIADEANVEINAMIVAQNAQLIEQNKKVLALLEKIAAKK